MALAPPASELGASLKAQWHVRLETSEREVMTGALLDRADYELDQACRTVELEALALVGKDRSAPEYRALFPDGLAVLVALRGTAQVRKVEQMVGTMRERAPDLGARHAQTLLELASKMVAAEKTAADAHQGYAEAFAKERLLRFDLVRQLRRNEGALTTVYPGNRALVRSFFPRRRVRAAVESAPLTNEPTAAAGAAPPASPTAGA
ncbi:MAG: hypothetical protein JW940_37595 [Polyangiaceae bacterium]|nr:hypothetical protein [Polyangiaceae bacterium]